MHFNSYLNRNDSDLDLGVYFVTVCSHTSKAVFAKLSKMAMTFCHIQFCQFLAVFKLKLAKTDLKMHQINFPANDLNCPLYILIFVKFGLAPKEIQASELFYLVKCQLPLMTKKCGVFLD